MREADFSVQLKQSGKGVKHEENYEYLTGLFPIDLRIVNVCRLGMVGNEYGCSGSGRAGDYPNTKVGYS